MGKLASLWELVPPKEIRVVVVRVASGAVLVPVVALTLVEEK